MDADNYQREAKRSAIYPEESAVEYVALGLASEAGELAGKVKKQIRDGRNWNGEKLEDHRQAMIAELGDVLWYAAEMAGRLNVTLSEVMQRNLDKLRDREERGVLGGSGDNR